MTVPQLTENARKILERRYLKKDEFGKLIETHGEMFWRVAQNIAQADLIYDKQRNLEPIVKAFYEMMANLLFLPNSPTLMNAGTELQQLSACFVLPVEDSMESIFETLKNAALIHKSGGGTGFSFSRLRPKNDTVLSTKGVASGPVSFMNIFDVATETIKQGGTRRGANMGILRVDHPDILEFIRAKEDHNRLRNFNLSVGITDAFMKAVAEDKTYDLINPRTGQVTGRLKARQVFDLLGQSAWKNGEPGVIFLERLNQDNPTPLLGEIESTNPCGEQPLLPYESCNLGSINLARFVMEGKIDFSLLKKVVQLAVHFLDNVIDMNHYPLPQIEKVTKGNRKIGLGVMGFADLLLQMEVPYDSEMGLKIAEEIMAFIQTEARQASENLAKERGPFPNFSDSLLGQRQELPRRNATLTTIAPTGTISLIADCSSGIEPLYALVYERIVLEKEKIRIVNPYFKKISQQEGLFSEQLLEEIFQQGSLRRLLQRGVPEKWRRVFVTAQDISPEWHVRMQAAFQKYTDNAVSKTVNFPAESTEAEVAKVFHLAYKMGCKGVTVYRQGSREGQVLQVPGRVEDRKSVYKEDAAKESGHFRPIKPRPRPEVTCGQTRKISTGCGSLYVTINEDKEGIFEVFAQMGKSGGCAACQNETTGRLVSLALRSGIAVEVILHQLQGIRCPAPIWENGSLILSCSDAIARALKKYYQKGLPPSSTEKEVPEDKGLKNCPECGGILAPESGCFICRFCGFSRCP